MKDEVRNRYKTDRVFNLFESEIVVERKATVWWKILGRGPGVYEKNGVPHVSNNFREIKRFGSSICKK